MPRKPTGNVYESRGIRYARITIGPGKRLSFALEGATEAQAQERANVMADIAARLRRSIRSDQAEKILKRAAMGREMDAIERVVAALCRGELAPRLALAGSTYGDVARQWISGEIARQFPDRVPTKVSTRHDKSCLEHHILPFLEDVPIGDVTLDRCEEVLTALPGHLSQATRRNIAQVMRRVLMLAAFPLRLIPACPLPRGWLPDKGISKAKGYLFPDEDAQLMACTDVPLAWRLFFGFLNREGMRRGEAVRADRCDFDLERGAVTLDKNKTNDPRAWALSTTIALRVWMQIRTDDCPKAFVDEYGMPLPVEGQYSRRFRNLLRGANIERSALFESTSERRAVRCHDTRATFITLSLASGRSETWVADRTGHRSSAMINAYRRAARTVAELGLGDLRPLHEAIPEIAAALRKGAGKGGALAKNRERPEENRMEQGTGRTSRSHGGSTSGGVPLGKGGAPAATSGPIGPRAALSSDAAADSRSPRTMLAERLARSLVDALRVGDTGAALVAHNALGDLLGASSRVTDLGAVRRQRGGR